MGVNRIVYIERRPTIAASLLNLVWLWRAPDVETSLAQIPISSTSPSHQRSSVPDSGCFTEGKPGFWFGLACKASVKSYIARLSKMAFGIMEQGFDSLILPAFRKAATVWRRSSAVRAGFRKGADALRCVVGESESDRVSTLTHAVSGTPLRSLSVGARVGTTRRVRPPFTKASSHGRCYRKRLPDVCNVDKRGGWVAAEKHGQSGIREDCRRKQVSGRQCRLRQESPSRIYSYSG